MRIRQPIFYYAIDVADDSAVLLIFMIIYYGYANFDFGESFRSSLCQHLDLLEAIQQTVVKKSLPRDLVINNNTIELYFY